MNTLIVFANDMLVGTLTVQDGAWRFAYDKKWKAFALSPNLPTTTREFVDTKNVKSVEWFFENLLPEGRIKELIATRDRIDLRDTWAFLLRHGQDTAGALSLTPQELKTDKQIKLTPLSQAQLQKKIQVARSRNLPLMASWEKIRMSLAGTQEKLGLYIDHQGAMFLPEGDAPSTHIVKPENISADFPYCPANEFFCMRLAQALMLPVPAVDLLHLPEPLYVIERFDRSFVQENVKGNVSNIIKRLHQIDLCQVLNVPPSKKYESEGGLGLHDLFVVLQSNIISRPILTIKAVIQWIVFNYLIGNLDAHAKNIAFLAQQNKISAAPFYDMLCVEAYLPRQTMAMAIAGENKPGWVESIHWDAMAYEAGVAPRLVRSILTQMREALPKIILEIIKDKRLLPAERDFLRERVFPVIKERSKFAANALKTKSLTINELLIRKELDPSVIERLSKQI